MNPYMQSYVATQQMVNVLIATIKLDAAMDKWAVNELELEEIDMQLEERKRKKPITLR